ncbi:hypothetical protein EGT74_04390 [Chitinophaga lutea]|uniref:Uncharacterized protein n=1 Tax=Chitinophaga lutea TaxID=2488634 RepID=A0A3N4Q0S9_9BACT|nr:hypothetical protein [Chitinophaga lutea]RPE12789.1 hypothetical protein EGT74_04390 [Chitinophaga lutea]
MHKYQLTITPCELTIRPYFGYLPKIRVLACLAVALFTSLPFLQRQLTPDVTRVICAAGGILLLYALYDYLFHASAKFLFDKRTRSIYRINGIFFKKRLMSFEDMTILTTSEYGDREYSMGRKKNQFLKNYPISAPFGNSRKSRDREAEYREHILQPILTFIHH